MDSQTDKSLYKRLVTVFFFSAAFAYIESSVVVYLRALFYKQGFVFPLADFSTIEGFGPFLLTEIGREAATLVLILTASMLIARDFRQRLACFMIIFAVWDIFYYIWLKVLIGWPVSIMDWDILFLIPGAWAGPVLAPVVTSVTMLFISAILLGGRAIKVTHTRGIAFIITAILIVLCFCVAGLGITKTDYKSYFSWPVFIILHVVIIILILRCVEKRQDSVKGQSHE